MATALDVTTRALRRLGVLHATETPRAADAQHGIDTLNSMIASWPAQGMEISDTSLPLADRFEQGVIALLAVRLSEDYGVTPGPVLLSDADTGWRTLMAAFFLVEPLDLRGMIGSSGSMSGGIIE